MPKQPTWPGWPLSCSLPRRAWQTPSVRCAAPSTSTPSRSVAARRSGGGSRPPPDRSAWTTPSAPPTVSNSTATASWHWTGRDSPSKTPPCCAGSLTNSDSPENAPPCRRCATPKTPLRFGRDPPVRIVGGQVVDLAVVPSATAAAAVGCGSPASQDLAYSGWPTSAGPASSEPSLRPVGAREVHVSANLGEQSFVAVLPLQELSCSSLHLASRFYMPIPMDGVPLCKPREAGSRDSDSQQRRHPTRKLETGSFREWR